MRKQMDVTAYLNCSKPEITNSRLLRIINRDDASELESYSKEVGLRNMRDVIHYLVVNSKLKLLKRLIDTGLDVNSGIGHGILVLMCFSGGKMYLESLLFLLRYQLELNFKINYRGTIANFLDLVVYMSCSDPVITLLMTNGAYVLNRENIPFELDPVNVDYNIFLLKHVYSKNALIYETTAVELLMKHDYREYSIPLAQLEFNPEDLSIPIRLLMLSILPLSSRITRSILISLAGRLILDQFSLPLIMYRVEFEDLINLMKSLKVSVLSQIEWNIDWLAEWLFTLPCDSNKLTILRDEGIDFNRITARINIREDWQLALIQNGLAGQKSKSRIINLKGTSDTIIPQQNTNLYLIDEGILKQYREYYKRKSKIRHKRAASLNLKNIEVEASFNHLHQLLTP